MIGWMQSIMTGETLGEKVVVRQFARAYEGLLAGDDPVLDSSITDHDMEMKSKAEEMKFHQMAKIHDFLVKWQCSQNPQGTKTESRTQYKQIPAVGYISYTEEMVKASWSTLNHDGAAGFKLLETSPASATNVMSFRKTQVYLMALTALSECRTL
jgi:hypothetical protein